MIFILRYQFPLEPKEKLKSLPTTSEHFSERCTKSDGNQNLKNDIYKTMIPPRPLKTLTSTSAIPVHPTVTLNIQNGYELNGFYKADDAETTDLCYQNTDY